MGGRDRQNSLACKQVLTSIPNVKKRRKRWLVVTITVLLVLAVGAAAWLGRDLLDAPWQQLKTFAGLGPSRPRPQPAAYRALIEECNRERQRLATQYQSARTDAARAEVLQQARTYLETTLPKMMRCWLGTPWNFNGTTEQPGGNGIACGYFVVTILRDAGFRVQRIQLAQQASQTILRTFVPNDRFVLRVDVPYERFAAEVKTLNPGIYIVGLDSHVGFLVVRDGAFRMIHSSGCKPWCVVDESDTEAGALQRSSYRVLGNLTKESEVIRKWLLEKDFPTGHHSK
jgi:cell division protein FtsB